MICLDYHAQLIEFDGGVDLLHLLINYPPQAHYQIICQSILAMQDLNNGYFKQGEK
jgi:REP element-mobilizing transposase RayT